MDEETIVKGCPVGDGNPACVRSCGGWAKAWSTPHLTKHLRSKRLNSSNFRQLLSCGVLIDRVTELMDVRESTQDVTTT